MLSQSIAVALRGDPVSAEADSSRKAAQEGFDKAKSAEMGKRKEISRRGLRGTEREMAIEAEIAPLEQEVRRTRGVWLSALQEAVPRRELALGKHIDCAAKQYREYAAGFLQGADIRHREPLDFLADFASDACVERSGRVSATPFCFITGSGHQYFLDTARELMDKVTAELVRAALFEPWTYANETLSMRWDPAEDRRYALLDRDPTASGNKPRTVWMANLLAYRALALFPSAPTAWGLRTTGWGRSRETFTWPMWEAAAAPDMIRSLLLLDELGASIPDRSELQAQGVVAVYQSRRIRVGSGANFTINFTPARAI